MRGSFFDSEFLGSDFYEVSLHAHSNRPAQPFKQ